MSTVVDREASQMLTWNGARSYATTGADKLGACLDYWSKAGLHQGRDQLLVDKSMEAIFADDEETALAIVFGMRLITRKPMVEGIEEAQTGFGRRDEFAKAICWMHKHRPTLLYNNLHLIPVFGSWRDFFSLPLLTTLDRKKVFALAAANLGDHLLRKYLPQIRARSKIRKSKDSRDEARVLWAKFFTDYLGINYAEYRRLKSEGAAHIWQKQMTRRDWNNINFNGIPGRAMMFHVSRKGKDGQTVFERHGQIERLRSWALEKPQVKFTGYPYELTAVASAKKRPSLVQRIIYDRQWLTAMEPMQGHQLGNVLCAIDTSGSMECPVPGVPTLRCVDICLSLGLAFSEMNVGAFHNSVAAFDNVSRLIELPDGTFTDRLHYLEEKVPVAWGGTNFQSLIDLIVQIRRGQPEIPLDEFPETLLVVSDMQFNPTDQPSWREGQLSGEQLVSRADTNYRTAMAKLHAVGLGDLRIIWWLVNGEVKDFPVEMHDRGTYLVGGFDPNVLKGIMGLSRVANEKKATAAQPNFEAATRKEETPLDGMLNFLRQPIFDLLVY